MCDKCNQTGYVQYTEWVPTPFGSGNCPMPVTELCDCLENGHCPVCDTDLETLSDDEPDTLYCVNCDKTYSPE